MRQNKLPDRRYLFGFGLGVGLVRGGGDTNSRRANACSFNTDVARIHQHCACNFQFDTWFSARRRTCAR